MYRYASVCFDSISAVPLYLEMVSYCYVAFLLKADAVCLFSFYQVSPEYFVKPEMIQDR